MGSYEYSSSSPTSGSSVTQSSQSFEISAKKICLVCGDKALGYNFNAITCESCKAFFRRNALKQKVFKCPFREQCEITILSRRFCQKCRLRKCLEVGMLTDLIMTTRGNGDRVSNANGCGGGSLKVRKRRRHRDSATINVLGQEANNKTPQTTPDPISPYSCNKINAINRSDVSPQVSPQYGDQYPMGIDRWHNSENIGNSNQYYVGETKPPMPDYFDYGYEYEWRKPIFCSPMGLADTATIDNNNEENRLDYKNDECDQRKQSLLTIEDSQTTIDNNDRLYSSGKNSSSSNSSSNDDNNNNWTVCTLTGNTIGRSKHHQGIFDDWAPVMIDFSSSLSAWKLFRLEELLSANEIMAVPNRGPPISFADISLADHMGEVCVRRCVQLSRRVQAFRNLLPPDQITLLKGAATELMALRGLMVYQPQVDSWRPIGFPHRYLRLECSTANKKIRKFYSLFPPDLRTNEPIMLCLSSIILFDPTQNNLYDRESVRLQQQFYFDLLKEYLKSVYNDSDDTYWRVCQLLQVLRQKVHKLMPVARVELDPQDIEVLSVSYDWRSNDDPLSRIDSEYSSGLTICPLED